MSDGDWNMSGETETSSQPSESGAGRAGRGAQGWSWRHESSRRAWACVFLRRPSPDLIRAAQVYPDIHAVDLEHGRRLYLTRCTACHQAYAPDAIAADEWPGHVEEMRKRARLEGGGGRESSRSYLVTMAQPARASVAQAGGGFVGSTSS